jgi:hypothetical protein
MESLYFFQLIKGWITPLRKLKKKPRNIGRSNPACLSIFFLRLKISGLSKPDKLGFFFFFLFFYPLELIFFNFLLIFFSVLSLNIWLITNWTT